MRNSTLFCAALLCSQTLIAQVDVLTQHNDAQRTGWNSHETQLTTTNVAAGLFGKLYSYPVDDNVYAQPLIATGINISGGTHNIIIICTVNNTVYAFDADNAPSAGPYWQTLLTSPGARPARNSDFNGASLCGGSYTDFAAKIGIVGTPVIDKASGTIYLVTKDVTTDASNNNTFHQYLHALDITTGNEKSGSPKPIAATVPGTGVGSVGGQLSFSAFTQNQRPGLLLLNGIIYIAWAGHCDMDPYHGWLLGFNATNLQLVSAYCTTANGEGGGTWQSGNGVAADPAGNIYISTGNGLTTDVGPNPINLSSSLIKLATSGNSLAVSDWFTPNNYASLNSGDLDFGPCQTLVIPGMNRVLAGAKDGHLYLCDVNNLGKYSNTGNNVVQDVNLGGKAHLRTSFGYYKGTANEFVYVWPEQTPLTVLPVNRTAGNFNPMTQYAYAGPTGESGACMSTSSNGSDDNSAILWVTHANNCDANHQTCPGIVRAFSATDLNNELWNSKQVTSDDIGNFAKFNSPVTANGKLYVATFSNNVAVYGLIPGGTRQTCPTANIAAGKTATSSADEDPIQLGAAKAVDGDMNTRWSSAFTDNQWIYVDLGQSYDICQVNIYWETALGKDFDIQVSNDAQTWTTVLSVTGNTSPTSSLYVQGTGRYIRMLGIHRGTQYGYSIWEFQVFGNRTVTCKPPTLLPTSNIQTNSATINWNAVTGATSYTLQYAPTSNPGYVTTASPSSPITGTSYTLTSLDCGAGYNVQVAANCSNNQTSTFASSAFTTLNCPNCGFLPTRWSGSSVGGPTIPGASCYDNSTYTVSCSGAGIGGTADQFQFAYKSVSGDDEFFGRITSLSGGSANEKAGIMIRQGLNPGDPNAFVGLSSSGALFQYRTVSGGPTTVVSSPQGQGITPPYYVRLTKAGTVYTPYISPDGLTWTAIAPPQDAGFGGGTSTLNAGLAVTSGDNSALATMTFDNFSQSASNLPVTLSSFTGKSTGTTVILQWTTELEQDVSHFEVERSSDGSHFASIATVTAEGNSSNREDYTTTDEHPVRGINYYRLRTVDLDGRFAYSPIILIRSDNAPTPTLFPNPASSYFRLAAGSDPIREVNVYDMAGRRALGLLTPPVSNMVFVPCSGLARGVYFVEIKTAHGRYVQKLLKQ